MSDFEYMLRCGIPRKKALEMVKARGKAGAEKAGEKSPEQIMLEKAEAYTSPSSMRICNGPVVTPGAVEDPVKAEDKETKTKDRKRAVVPVPDVRVKTEVVTLVVTREEYDAKCAELEAAKREIEVLKGDIGALKEENRKLERNNGSLRNTISNTSRNAKNADLAQLRNKVEALESENRGLKHDIERYERIIDANGIDVRNITSGDHLFAMMTSPTVMHCPVFENRAYTVQFGARFTVMRFIPDEQGPVVCRDGDVDLPALGRYGVFESLRKMPVTVTDGVITVTV